MIEPSFSLQPAYFRRVLLSLGCFLLKLVRCKTSSWLLGSRQKVTSTRSTFSGSWILCWPKHRKSEVSSKSCVATRELKGFGLNGEYLTVVVFACFACTFVNCPSYHRSVDELNEHIQKVEGQFDALNDEMAVGDARGFTSECEAE